MRKTKPNPVTNGDGVTLQTLALFIILLSFFIVLNSISTFEEEKIKPVMESIGATFANRVVRNELAPSVTPDPAQAIGEGTVYDHLEELFQSQFKQISNPQRDDERGLFYTTLPYKALKNALLDIRPHHLSRIDKSGEFLSLLKSLILSNNHNFRLDIVLETPDDLFALTQEEQTIVAQKVAFLGERLAQVGFPPERISIGISSEGVETLPEGDVLTSIDNNIVLLVIRPYTMYDIQTSPLQKGGSE
ncbi:MAG: flagellar motor protein MotB [Alphaproteobacteria bacterium]|nr:flagellar motor protein MotB [Alphaproteobacteria bacterium]